MISSKKKPNETLKRCECGMYLLKVNGIWPKHKCLPKKKIVEE